MESANLRHQRQLPDQPVGSPPALAAPSCYGFGSNANHVWSSSPTTTTTATSTFTSYGNSNPNYDGIASNSRESNITTRNNVKGHHHDHHHNINLASGPLKYSFNTVNELGFPLTSDESYTGSSSTCTTAQSAYDMHLAKIKEELSESLIPKFTEMLNGHSSTNNDDYYGQFFLRNERRDLMSSTVATTTTENLLIKALSSSQVNGNQISADSEFDSKNIVNGTSGTSFGGLLAVGCRGQFSQIYPSINISNLNSQSSSSTISASSLGISRISTQPLNDNINLGVFMGSRSNHYGGLLDEMHQPHSLSCGHGKGISSFNSEITEAKRPAGSIMEPKTTQSAASNKKPRLESRTTCPPFKVRKEKLGDRIAALQQLVSPFGKTDTASVLMEAIGYIKFLQNQVETLSVPYKKSSRNKSNKSMQRGLKEDGIEELKRDLRSRGLCLVPLSCMSYVAGDGGGSMWPPPNFGGRA
ncbi:Myc-type, basic helix-loop-helix (bHLH) domain containing protein [Parasponia andersonii]|uniref:Myc-type, basic helix-loop-helix (BHLH) domain containing protein n=1 Tax=Parasponia andersonii TaxID=3476 RepID=A0A2P5C1H7_PARAD|nr:Myc-type, basic helix-loop-helix (bHLH) domain containing protein [Parasponia andersonii]